MQVVANKVGKLDMVTAVRLRFEGLSTKQIGEKYGITRQAVEKRIAKVYKRLDPQSIDAYNKHEDSLLTMAKELMVQHAVQPDTIQKASLNNVAYAYTQFNSAQRLLRGESTANHSIKGIVEHHQTTLEALQASLVALEDD